MTEDLTKLISLILSLSIYFFSVFWIYTSVNKVIGYLEDLKSESFKIYLETSQTQKRVQLMQEDINLLLKSKSKKTEPKGD